ncbi:hypothetical protein ACJX0J_034343 [Zea mays]
MIFFSLFEIIGLYLQGTQGQFAPLISKRNTKLVKMGLDNILDGKKGFLSGLVALRDNSNEELYYMVLPIPFQMNIVVLSKLLGFVKLMVATLKPKEHIGTSSEESIKKTSLYNIESSTQDFHSQHELLLGAG